MSGVRLNGRSGQTTAGDLLPALKALPSDMANGAARMVLLGEEMSTAASCLRDALGTPADVEQGRLLVEGLFWHFDHLLGVLSGLERATEVAYDATTAPGSVWDHADAARVRGRLRALDDAMVNLASCRETFGGAHMLLGHAATALSRIDGQAGESAEGDAADE